MNVNKGSGNIFIFFRAGAATRIWCERNLSSSCANYVLGNVKYGPVKNMLQNRNRARPNVVEVKSNLFIRCAHATISVLNTLKKVKN